MAATGALVVSFGEMLIDFVPDEAGVSLAESKAFVKAAGGAPANVAVAIARLGGRSAFIGKFGDDEFGHMLVKILNENNVDVSGVRFDRDARTALAFVTLTRSGEREFMFYRNPSADMRLTEPELDVDLIKRAGIFHFGSISLISEPCRSTHMAAIQAAKNAGAILSFDPNIRLPLWPSKDEACCIILMFWAKADIIKVSDDEVALLTQGNPDDEDVIMKLWFDGLKLLVVTTGSKGSRYFTKNFKGTITGYAVKKVDATGAGDAFVGSLLNSIAKDKTVLEDEKKLREAIKFASACGAITCTKKGAIPALPTPTMVKAFLANPTMFDEEDSPNNADKGNTLQKNENADARWKIFGQVIIVLGIGFAFVALLQLVNKYYSTNI